MASQSDQTSLTHEDYLIGWICPLEVEQIAATLMLDARHVTLPQPETDQNVYTLGSIHGHNIVIAGLPIASNNAAAVVATQMRRTFPRMKFGLLVGIGGGVPTSTDEGPIRLGHIVVSKPNGENSGAVQYDHGKAKAGHFQRTGSLMPPPMILLNAAQTMAVAIATADEDPLLKNVRRINVTNRKLRRFKFPGRENDRLFEASYIHENAKASCARCNCDPNKILSRQEDIESEEYQDSAVEDIIVHRGTIASGELVIKDAILRDELAEQYDLLCFETEAAGALTDFPCLVIRGISDYCDTHKNNDWHGYAAAAAAAYARNLFLYLPVAKVKTLDISLIDVQSMKDGIDYIRNNQHWTQLKAWLGASDPSSNYNEAFNLRQKGTCSWLTNGASFLDWQTKPGSFLWLVGRAGSGKTILSTSAIEALHDIQDSNRVLIYFYFDFKDTGKQSFSSMVRSLVYQLASKSKVVEKEVSRCFEDNVGETSRPSDQIVESLLMKALLVIESLWIIVDALDECQPRDGLLDWLVKTASQRAESLHIFVTSRDEEDIRAQLQPLALSGEVINLQQDFNREDISLYIRSRLYDSNDFARWKHRRHVLKMIEENLTKKADQMFRWVACQLDTLRVCIDFEQIQDELENLPQTLDETYERMIRNIHPANQRKAITLLQMLVVSDRPLRLEEAVDVVATNAGKVSFDPEKRMPRPRDIALICPSLINVTESSPPEDDFAFSHEYYYLDHFFYEDDIFKTFSEVNGPHIFCTVALSHFSVKNYLQSDRLHADIQVNFAVGNIEKMIAKLCLSYLLNLPLNPNSNETIASFPWSRHAAEYWYLYANQADKDENLQSLTEHFFATGPIFNNWLSIFDRFPYETSKDAQSQLFYASESGTTKCVQKLIREGADPNTQGRSSSTKALQAASRRGHKDIVKMLLVNGANVNAEDINGMNAVKEASEQGHKDIVELLIDKGADLDAGRDFHNSALEAASRTGRKAIVELLLDAGADINARGNHGSALEAASGAGHKDIVELLLGAGADINAQGNHGSALEAAICAGRKDIVELLLGVGADINAQGHYGNALEAALDNGQKDMIELLLDKGANVYSPSTYRGGALYQASEKGQKDMVELLLSNVASLNIFSFQECLAAASGAGHTDVVELLLEKRTGGFCIDYDRKDQIVLSTEEYGGILGLALVKARMYWQEDIEELLLDHGAVQDYIESQEIVRRLCDRSTPDRESSDNDSIFTNF